MKNNDDYENLRIADELYSLFGMFVGGGHKDPVVSAVVDEICAGRTIYEAKNDIYLKAIELCENSEIPEAQWLVFDCYKNLPVKYRDQQIALGCRLAERGWDRTCGADYYGVANGNITNRLPENDGWRSANLQLGSLLCAVNELDDALKHAKTAYEKYPNSELCCKLLSDVYLKMNDIDNGLQVLYSYKSGPYYAENRQYIDSAIADLEDKKARGYVFRPRKKKTT